jgi:hypothetical protein
LTVPRQEAGLAFRVEMAITAFFLGYWKVLLGIVAATLLGFLALGQYRAHMKSSQQEAASRISDAGAELRIELAKGLDPSLRSLLMDSSYDLGQTLYNFSNMEPEQQMALVSASPGAARVFMSFNSLDPRTQEAMVVANDEVGTILLFLGPPDDAAKGTLAAGASRLALLASDAGGAAGAQAGLQAAELYRRVGDAEAQRAALEVASQKGEGALRFAAESGLATLDLDAGQVDAALARYRTLMVDMEGYLAEEAALQLALALEFHDRRDEAAQVYTDFLTRWPESPRVGEVTARQQRLSGGQG